MRMMSSDMCLPIFPAEHPSLWSSRIKNLGTRDIKCSCSFKGDILSSCDTLRKFRSKLKPLVPKHGRHHRKVIVMGSHMRVHAKSSPAHWLHSRMEDVCFSLQPCMSPSERDKNKRLNCVHPLVKSLFFTKDSNSADFKGSDFDFAFCERNQPIEEPWFLNSPILSHSLSRPIDTSSLMTKSSDQSMIKFQNNESEDLTEQHSETDSLEATFPSPSLFKFGPYGETGDISGPTTRESNISRTFSLRNQPVEEPWLIEHSSSQGSHAKPVSNGFVEDDANNPELTGEELTVQLHQVTENLQPEEESSAISQKESVPKVILINSSVCTMQRIAVLEDGKLVELLLEPVKNNVSCDSVYLGVVTKLVPHMGGAFVNIGTSRPSLMDIKNNREPFIFPPFSHSKEKEVNGSATFVHEEHSGANETRSLLQDVDLTDEMEDDEIDDETDRYSHDEYTEHDLEDDEIDIEALKGNVNGNLSGHSEVDANSTGQIDKNVNKVKESDNGAPSPHLRSVERDCEDESLGKNKWGQVRKGTKVVVQVVKEGLGTKGPTLTAYPKLRSRFWVLSTCCSTIGISKKVSGVERTRLRVIAKTLQPEGFGLTARTVAAGHSLAELRKDLDGLISTWKDIMENAKSAALAADEGVEGALPVILHRAMGQTLSVVQDYFNEKVNSMVVDSARTYHEVTNYLQQIAPDLCDRVELYNERPLFDEYKIEEEISNMLSKWVNLDNGGYLVIEQTEALVSIDVNGGQCMLGQETSQENAILDVNLAAAKQIAREIRLRDIGGIIVVDFIDMTDDANKRLVYEEVKKSVERDRSTVKVSELSKNGLMEITRKRVRPSVTFMISEPCTCCHGTGRVEALETSFSKIEQEICRLLAVMDKKADPEDPKSWPKFMLRVDRFMCNYLTSGKRTRLATLSSSLKVWILLKVDRGFSRGAFEVKPLTSEKDYDSHKQATIQMLRPNAPSGKITFFPIKKWKSGRK